MELLTIVGIVMLVFMGIRDLTSSSKEAPRQTAASTGETRETWSSIDRSDREGLCSDRISIPSVGNDYATESYTGVKDGDHINCGYDSGGPSGSIAGNS